jgi:hypothetical protein
MLTGKQGHKKRNAFVLGQSAETDECPPVVAGLSAGTAPSLWGQ